MVPCRWACGPVRRPRPMEWATGCSVQRAAWTDFLAQVSEPDPESGEGIRMFHHARSRPHLVGLCNMGPGLHAGSRRGHLVQAMGWRGEICIRPPPPRPPVPPATRPPNRRLQVRMWLHEKNAEGLFVEGRSQVREKIGCLAADDLCFHRVDTDVVVEPDSMALSNVGDWTDPRARTGQSGWRRSRIRSFGGHTGSGRGTAFR